MKEDFKPFEDKMDQVIKSLNIELSTIRAGRANPRILDNVMVEYYGTLTPISQVGNINVPEARILSIQPWDTSVLKDIEKALQIADLGINPVNDGKAVRLVFPELTEERRKDLAKDIKKTGEETKVKIRNVRREALDVFSKMEKDSELSEDELKTYEEETQKLTDKFVTNIDVIVEEKIKDIMNI